VRPRVRDGVDPAPHVVNAWATLDDGDRAHSDGSGIARIPPPLVADTGPVTAPRRQAPAFTATATRGQGATVDVMLVHSGASADADAKRTPDAGDDRPAAANARRRFANGDGTVDVCDTDDDEDGMPNAASLCPALPDPDQPDANRDGRVDPRDDDRNAGGVADTVDDCSDVANVEQADADGEGDAREAAEHPAVDPEDDLIDPKSDAGPRAGIASLAPAGCGLRGVTSSILALASPVPRSRPRRRAAA